MKRLVNFFWGDVGTISAALRTSAKIIAAVMLGWVAHEVLLLPRFFSVADSEIAKEFQTASKELGGAGLPALHLCLVSQTHGRQCWDGNGRSDQATLPAHEYQGPVLAYQVQGIANTNEWFPAKSGEFFYVHRLTFLPVSSVEISSSIDAFLRAIEAVAFNEGTSPTELELCAGTRTLLDQSKCRHTSYIQGDYPVLDRGSEVLHGLSVPPAIVPGGGFTRLRRIV